MQSSSMQSPCLHHQRAGTATTLSSFFCLRMLLIHMQRRPAEAAAAAAAQPRWNTVHLRRGESRVRQHIHVHNQNGCLCRAVSFPALNNKKKKEKKERWYGMANLSLPLSPSLSRSLFLCVSLSPFCSQECGCASCTLLALIHRDIISP